MVRYFGDDPDHRPYRRQDDKVAMKAKAVGAATVLHKPVSGEVLIKAIYSDATNGRRWTSRRSATKRQWHRFPKVHF